MTLRVAGARSTATRSAMLHHPRQQEGEKMTALNIAAFKKRRCISHLEAALEALDLYQRALDDADRMVPQSSEYLQRAQDYRDDLKSDIEAMLQDMKEERSTA